MRYSVTAVESAPENAPILLRGNIYTNIEIAKEIGYEAMELHIKDPKKIDAFKLREYCNKEDFRISSIGTGAGYVIDKLSLCNDDKEVRVKAIERLKNHIDLGASLDSTVIIGNMRGIMPDLQYYNKYEKYCLEGMKEVVEYAEKKDVMLVLEAINRYETNFLNTVDETLDFIGKIDSEILKVHIDTFHMNIEEPNIEESIYRCGNKLGHVHFADSNRMYPGMGHIDFRKVINALEKVEYKEYIAIECLIHPESFIAAKNSYEYLKNLDK